MRPLPVVAALVLAAGAAATTAPAVTPDAEARRDAVAQAQSDYVASRNSAKVGYAAARSACARLEAPQHAECVAQTHAERSREFAQARAAH